MLCSKPVTRLLAAFAVALLSLGASAQDYQIQFFAKGLIGPPLIPTCTPGKVIFSTAGVETPWSPPAGCTIATIEAWGGGGAGSSPSGGAGAYAAGQLALTGGTLAVRVGAAGTVNSSRAIYGGGGYSAVFQGGSPVVVAAGGGGRGIWARGGAGGQTAEGSFPGQTPTGAAGGAGCNGATGSAWTGGIVQTWNVNAPSGNGGGGYFGGGGGCVVWWNSMDYGSAGGGGSSFTAPSLSSATITPGSFQLPGNNAGPDRGDGGEPNKDGRVVISYR